MILATDLDGTFLGGKSIHKQKLYRLIRKNISIRLVFVTGRGLETVIPLLNDPIIPNPDYIICDVGATVVNGHTLEPIEPLQSEIAKKWPGSLAIRECLKDINDLQYQEVPQQRRCSFYTSNEDTIEEVKRRVEQIDCNIIYSANKFLDVLPKGINKGISLINLVKYLNENEENVLVAGDTLNDLEMYHFGFKGVVVGNAEEKLINATFGMKYTYLANTDGAGGIIEAMKHFPLFSHVFKQDNEETADTANNEVQQLIMTYNRFSDEKKEVNGKTEHVPPKALMDFADLKIKLEETVSFENKSADMEE